MYEELIKRLRECTAEQNGEKTLWHQAADAIEELQQITTHYEAESKGWWLAACDAKEERERLMEQIPKWIPVTERLPETNVDVLALYEYENTMCKKWTYICRASYIPKFTVLIEDKWNDCDGGWEDYNEDDDSFYVPEGWYEETSEGNGDGMSWFINATVTHWMPLPQPPESGR